METQEIYDALDDLYAKQLQKGQRDIEQFRRLVRELDPSIDRTYAAFLVKRWILENAVEMDQPTTREPSSRPNPYPSLFVFVAFIVAALGGYAIRGDFRGGPADFPSAWWTFPLVACAIVAAILAHCGAIGGAISGFIVGLFLAYVLAPFLGGAEILFERGIRTYLLELLFGGLPAVFAIVGAIVCDRWERRRISRRVAGALERSEAPERRRPRRNPG